MKKMLMAFVLVFLMQSICQAAFVKQLPYYAQLADLREYQQSQGTMNVIAAPFKSDQMYIAAFNFDEQQSGDKTTFYRAIGVLGQSKSSDALFDVSSMQPLLVKKVSGSAQSFAEQLVNKDGTAPYKQQLRAVQTDSSVPIAYLGGDATKMVYLGRFSVDTAAGTFDDCIGIKIYNDKTNEGLVQYLAKGHGIVYLEGLRADGTTSAVAELYQVKTMDSSTVNDFKQRYFK